MKRSEPAHHVVIVGGGFGGLYAARHLRRAPVRITLVDRRNFHLFQPLLYQVATGALSPANIATPLRALFRRQMFANVLLGEVVDIDVANRELKFRDGSPTRVHYDTLVVATGSQFNYFGHDEWAKTALGLKTVEEALVIRRRVLSAFEKAEFETDVARQQAQMTFVVVGGGPTGVEMAGALSEVARHTLRGEFRNIQPSDAKIVLIEALDHLLGRQFPPQLERKALQSLERMGVTVRLKTTVVDMGPQGVTLKCGEHTECLAATTVLWTAGIKASPLGAVLAAATGAETDRLGRLIVEPDLSLRGHPEIFAIGDLASFKHQTGEPLGAVAPVAMQQGRYVAELIGDRLKGKNPPPAFHYRDKGTLATIGRATAVADLGWIKASGYWAWLLWLFVHIMYLVQFQNRVLVLIQWAFNYFTRGRSARLITDEQPREHTGSN